MQSSPPRAHLSSLSGSAADPGELTEVSMCCSVLTLLLVDVGVGPVALVAPVSWTVNVL